MYSLSGTISKGLGSRNIETFTDSETNIDKNPVGIPSLPAGFFFCLFL
jgi:hypothetical protein